MRLRRAADRIAPMAEQTFGAQQFERAHAGLFLGPQALDRRQRPGRETAWRPGASRRPGVRRLGRANVEQPPVGQNQQSSGVVQAGVQVGFEPDQRRLARRQLGLDRPAQIGRERFPRVVGGVQMSLFPDRSMRRTASVVCAILTSVSCVSFPEDGRPATRRNIPKPIINYPLPKGTVLKGISR